MVAVKCSDCLLVKTEMTGKLASNGEKTNGSNWFGLFPFSPKSRKFRLEIKFFLAGTTWLLSALINNISILE